MSRGTDVRKRVDPLAPIRSAPPAVQDLIKKILRAEKDKLYMDKPVEIAEDLLKIIKDEIREPAGEGE